MHGWKVSNFQRTRACPGRRTPSWGSIAMPNTLNRFQRQASLVPREALEPLTVTIIGVGAIGRQVALQLAALGVPRLQLCDFDAVDVTNVTTQGYAPDDIGVLKVQATARDVRRIEPGVQLTIAPERFRPQNP